MFLSNATFNPQALRWSLYAVYPKKYAHGFCFAVLCCGYTLTDFPTSIRLTSLALWQSNDCPSASKATLMNMDKYFMWIHYERLRNHNKAKHNKTVCIFLGIYCILQSSRDHQWKVITYPTVSPIPLMHSSELSANTGLIICLMLYSFSALNVSQHICMFDSMVQRIIVSTYEFYHMTFSWRQVYKELYYIYYISWWSCV